MATAFADKLALVLRALAISRGRLAVELGINKSVVSRWHSGQAQTSGENLSRLTRLIAGRAPGFTGLDWDRDLPGLAGVLGAGGGRTAEDGPAFDKLDEVRDLTARHGASWEGHWWGYRRPFRRDPGYVRDKVRIRRDGAYLKMDWQHDNVAGDGWFMVGDGKGYVLLPHRYAAIPAMVMLYTLDGKPVQVLDGMVTTVTISAAREIVAAPYVLIRAANLLADAVADDAFHQARSPTDWTIAAEALPPGVYDRLTSVSSADGILRMPSATSLSRFCTADELDAAQSASAGFSMPVD